MLSGLGALLLVAATLFVLASMYEASSYAATKRCPSITTCRTAIAWNHAIVVDVNRRLAIANNRAGGGRAAPPTCHRIESCRDVLARQKHARLWAEGAWQRLRHDNSPAGAMRIVRYRFHPCGKVAQARAHLIVGWESGWIRTNVNGAFDTGWWQFELTAHPDITVAEAEDAWWSTGRAVRDSKCGRDWSPEWSSVRDHGKTWP